MKQQEGIPDEELVEPTATSTEEEHAKKPRRRAVKKPRIPGNRWAGHENFQCPYCEHYSSLREDHLAAHVALRHHAQKGR